MERFVLTDAQWAKMEPHCLGKADRPWPQRERQPAVRGGGAVDRAHRQPVAGLAGMFGNWNTVFKRFRDWVKADVFKRLFDACVGRSGHGIRHGRRHHRQGPPPRAGRKRGTQSQAIGRSKGGMTTKILALTDALGNLVRFVLLPGQRFDTVGVAPLIEDSNSAL